MAYTGNGVFDNDDAFDWLDACTRNNIARKLRPILKKIINYEMKPDEIYTEEEIQSTIDRRVQSVKEHGGGHDFEKRNISMDEYIEIFKKEIRYELENGTYGAPDYGPVEQALAAIGLIAITLGIDVGPIAGSEEEIVQQRAAWLKNYKIKKDLIALAIQALEKILTNENYINMRKWWLDMDNKKAESWDPMFKLKELKENLKAKLV